VSSSLAVVYAGVPGQLALQEIPRPEPSSGEILVRVIGCTLCGSDLHTFEGRRQVPTPTVLGHEIAGEIVALGPDAPRCDLANQELRCGSRITWSLVASCCQCFFCQHDLPQKCVKAVKYGHEPLHPGRELLGGLAEHCLLVPGTSIVRLPDDFPLEVACPANCATATAAAALEAAGEIEGTRVLVLGAGLLGLTVCAMASARHAAEVICVEVNSERRARARLFGATHAIAPEELINVAGGLTQNRGVDVLVELTGSPAALETAWPVVRMGGTFVLVGSVFPARPVALPLEQIVRRHLILRGIHNYRPRHLLAAVQFASQYHRDFPFAELVAEWHTLASVENAMRSARNPSRIRVGIRPS
jgi:alcohol dehydrogenase